MPVESIAAAGGPAEAAAAESEENIQVIVRVRPLLPHEAGGEWLAGEAVLVEDDETVRIRSGEAGRSVSLRCRYDAVLGPEAPQDAVYSRVRSCASSVLDGYNATIFAYGQTGSGKTHTMFGPPGYRRAGGSGPLCVSPASGVIPRAIRDIFAGADRAGVVDFQVFASFAQVYNEALYDMLRDGERSQRLQVREDRGGVYVEGLSEFAVRSAADCLALLRVGEEQRARRETRMNAFSSRSHSLFQLVIEQRLQDASGERHLRSKFNLVDLAGSEKWDTGAGLGAAHIGELTRINLSLHTLGRCIAALARRCRPDAKSSAGRSDGAASSRTPHVPYRDSRLTRLLQDSLGGNCKTRIVATLSPAAACSAETASTLRFADSAKRITLRVRTNATRPLDHRLAESLRAENARLKALAAALAGLLERNGVALAGLGEAEREAAEGILKPAALAAAARRAEADGPSTLERAARESRQRAAAPLEEDTALKERRAAASPGAPATGGGTAGGSGPAQVAQATGGEAERALRRVSDLLEAFFRFDIEEDDLKRRAREELAAFRKGSAKAPAARTASPALAGAGALSAAPSTPPNASASPSRPRHLTSPFPAAHAAVPDRKASPALADSSQRTAAPPSLSWRRAGTGRDAAELGLSFRVRGGAGRGGGSAASAEKGPAPDAWVDGQAWRHEGERRLQGELKAARQRMKKTLQLQEWLKEKEAREAMALEEEEELQRSAQREKEERDRKFKERAAKQKAKLLRYYAKQHADALAEQALPGGRGGPASAHPTPAAAEQKSRAAATPKAGKESGPETAAACGVQLARAEEVPL